MYPTTIGELGGMTTKRHTSEAGSDFFGGTTNLATRMLLGRLKQGDDAEAWRLFVDLYIPRILRWLLSKGLPRQDAEDVTQDVSIKLLTAFRSFDYDPSKGHFRAWLRTITRNCWVDYLRKRPKFKCVESAELLSELTVGELEDKMEREWQRELVAQAFQVVAQVVSERDVQIYKLLTEEEMTAGEVAERFGMKVGAVYVVKNRMNKKLREEVNRLSGELEQ